MIFSWWQSWYLPSGRISMPQCSQCTERHKNVFPVQIYQVHAVIRQAFRVHWHPCLQCAWPCQWLYLALQFSPRVYTILSCILPSPAGKVNLVCCPFYALYPFSFEHTVMHCIWCVVLDFYLICKSNSQDFTVKQNMISHCHILYPVHKRIPAIV